MIHNLVMMLPRYNEEITLLNMIIDIHRYHNNISIFIIGIEPLILTLIIMILLLRNFNFYTLVNNYPPTKLRKMETSHPGGEK